MTNRTDDIKVIREMMEKSTKFLSLSGLSGIFAGATALLGAGFAYYILNYPSLTDYTWRHTINLLLVDAGAVLIISMLVCFYLSWRKAKKKGEKIFNRQTYRVLYNLAIPLIAGGIFCLSYLLKGEVNIVLSGTLLFYGLALVNASKYTYEEIHYLGLTEIILGIAAAIFGNYALIIWALGFGVCHIIYGSAMYVKYDREK